MTDIEDGGPLVIPLFFCKKRLAQNCMIHTPPLELHVSRKAHYDGSEVQLLRDWSLLAELSRTFHQVKLTSDDELHSLSYISSSLDQHIGPASIASYLNVMTS